jgi:hypothetical protein
MAIKASGINRIDSLLDSYTWTTAPAQAYTVKYAFTTQAGYQVPDALKAAYLSAAQEWSNVANIRFVSSSSSTAQITYGSHDLSVYGQGVIGTTFEYGYSNGKLARADVVLDDRFNTGWACQAARRIPDEIGFFAIEQPPHIHHAAGFFSFRLFAK